MKALLKKNAFGFTINKAFNKVIHQCKNIKRPGQRGTWITDEVEAAYIRMHELGYAVSAETWKDETLVGGAYGLKIGKIFFGESMFANKNNASKFAFIKYVQLLQKKGIELIDCQVYTRHLASLGAQLISRQYFLALLEELIV